MSHLFDATTEYLEENVGPISNEPLTISCMYYPTSNVGATLVSIGLQSGAVGGWQLQTMATGAARARTLNLIGVGQVVQSPNFCTLNGWNHVVVSFSGDSNRQVILNGGTEATDATLVIAPTPDRWRIGIDTETATIAAGAWRVAQVAIWDVVLNAAEKKMLSYGVNPARFRPSALVRFVPVWGFSTAEPVFVSNAPASMAVNGSPTPSPHAPYAGSPFFQSDWTFPSPRVDVVKKFSSYDEAFPKFLLRKNVPQGRVI